MVSGVTLRNMVYLANNASHFHHWPHGPMVKALDYDLFGNQEIPGSTPGVVAISFLSVSRLTLTHV